MKIAILTISDKSFHGERQDTGGPAIAEEIQSLKGQIVATDIVPDEHKLISEQLKKFTDELAVDLILTTGGTGFSPRDRTPEATLEVIDRLAPGISEAMRLAGLKHTPNAMLSRGVTGIRRNTLIINLPGSPKAVRQCLQTILPALPHAIEVLKGAVNECGNPKETPN